LARPSAPPSWGIGDGERLGGYDAIAAVADDFIGRLVGDERFARFFADHSIDSTKPIRQLIVDQLCEATGGPCVYIGRDMKTTHEGTRNHRGGLERGGRAPHGPRSTSFRCRKRRRTSKGDFVESS
jgi:hypothetical protein